MDRGGQTAKASSVDTAQSTVDCASRDKSQQDKRESEDEEDSDPHGERREKNRPVLTWRRRPKLPREGANNLALSPQIAAFFDLGEAEFVALRQDSTLRELVRLWSTLDAAAKDIVKLIVESRTST